MHCTLVEKEDTDGCLLFELVEKKGVDGRLPLTL